MIFNFLDGHCPNAGINLDRDENAVINMRQVVEDNPDEHIGPFYKVNNL